jgi:ApeA N-terminal domain 1
MDFPCQGQWWLPGSPDESVFGRLTFTRRDGANLSLADALPGTGDERATDIILGQTAGGAYVTLLHAIRTAQPLFRLTATFPCSYHAPLLITGAAFDSEADMRFSLWQIRVPELKPWVGKHGFEVEASEVFDGRDCPSVQINYRTPDKQVLLCDAGGLDLTLAFWPLLHTCPDVRTVRQDVCLEVRQASHDMLEDYMKTATRFEHFLTLATGSLVRTGSIKAVVRTEETDAAHRPIIVDIFYQPIRNAPRRHPRTDEFLFTLPNIAGLEQNCFSNWFTKAEWLDPVCALYFGTLYNPSKYLDFNFLALVHAVEAYHRRASAETDQLPVEHEVRMKAILDAAPPAHRDWLEQKLTYSNELSRRRRLKLLFAQFSTLLGDLIPDRKAMISAIYDNRNYLTHYSLALEGRAATGARLLLMVEVLKLLLQACFLRELGLPDKKISEFVSRSRTVRMIRYLSNQIVAATGQKAS